ncbi:DeoR/GlpR family DNA-binding transcription regulator [Sporosarcina sp. CAU 1771]
MSPRERRKRIIQMLELNGKVEIIQLSEVLGVTPMTIRRDFDALEKQKKLIRTHGAAITPQSLIVEQTFESKAGQAVEEKKAIAREAVTFVRDGMTILLDSGTTTLQVAKLLKSREKLTVITNDIKIAAELMDSKLEIILLGGKLQNGVGSLYGSLTSETLRSLHVDLFFLGAPALHSSLGITATTIEKASLKKDMCNTAEQIILLADATKFHQKSFSRVCGLDDITTIITDDSLSSEVNKSYGEFVDILLAK